MRLIATVLLAACTGAQPTRHAEPTALPSASASSPAPARDVAPVDRVEPVAFVPDGNLREWNDRAPQALSGKRRLYVGTTTSGLALAVDGASTDELKVAVKTPLATLPTLGISHIFTFDAFEKQQSCSAPGGEPAPPPKIAECEAWRSEQLARRQAIAAQFTGELKLSCRASGTALEALLPYSELPLLTSATLDRLEIALPDFELTAALSLAAPAKVAPEGSLLEWCLAHPPAQPPDSAIAWSPRSPTRIIHWFNPWSGDFNVAKSPDTLVADLSARKELASFGEVRVERVERVEPPFADADRGVIVVSHAGRMTAAIRHGREKLGLLRRSEGIDLVFAFAGNATPGSLHEYVVGSAWALHIDDQGKLSPDRRWSVEHESGAAPHEIDPKQRLTSEYRNASVSDDGKHVSLTADLLDGDSVVGAFERRYDFQADTEMFSERPVRRVPRR